MFIKVKHVLYQAFWRLSAVFIQHDTYSDRVNNTRLSNILVCCTTTITATIIRLALFIHRLL